MDSKIKNMILIFAAVLWMASVLVGIFGPLFVEDDGTAENIVSAGIICGIGFAIVYLLLYFIFGGTKKKPVLAERLYSPYHGYEEVITHLKVSLGDR